MVAGAQIPGPHCSVLRRDPRNQRMNLKKPLSPTRGEVSRARSRFAVSNISFAALIMALICPPAAAAQAMPAFDPSLLVLTPGDALRITVWRQAELSGEFWIAADSSI